jgi:hypothetical protein
MRGYNSDEVLGLLAKWPCVEPPVYDGPVKEVVDSRWLALALVGAHVKNPSVVWRAQGDIVTVAGVIKSTGVWGNVIEFDGHEEVGIPTVKCTITRKQELAAATLNSVITARGEIIAVQLDPSGNRVQRVAIARAKVLSIKG